MSRARTVAVGLALWCAVVAVVASLVWVVVGRAGAGVLPSAQPQADVTGSLPVPHSRSAGDVSPGVVLTPRTSSSGPSAPPGSPTTEPTSGATSSPPSSSSSTPAPPAPTAQRRSWSGIAGHVVAECQGTASRFVSAYPNTGWRYQIFARGPAEVRVRFLRIGEDHGITVTARCVAGVPHFSVSGHESGDD
jgi:hypothetical protein